MIYARFYAALGCDALFPIFQSLTSSAESKLVKDFCLTKFVAGLHKDLNRYKNILPCESAYWPLTFSN